MVIYILVGILILSLARGFVFFRENKKLKSQIESIKQDFSKERVKIKADAKKRSGAVQWGLSIENFVPFMDKFPIPAEDCHFFGKPIDFIGFTDLGDIDKCKIHIIEVKSGSAFLNSQQKNIKRAVQEKRVEWHEVRVKGNSVKN